VRRSRADSKWDLWQLNVSLKLNSRANDHSPGSGLPARPCRSCLGVTTSDRSVRISPCYLVGCDPDIMVTQFEAILDRLKSRQLPKGHLLRNVADGTVRVGNWPKLSTRIVLRCLAPTFVEL